MEQHFRDKMTRKENYETLFLVAVKALAHQVDKEAIDMFSKLINRVTGVAWMESSEGAVKSKKEQDLDILAKIKNLDHRIK